MDMRKLVGRNFARLRREKGLTQEQVESRSGFSQQYLSGLEVGKRNPTVVTIYELAQALGVSHIELVMPPEGGEAKTARSRKAKNAR
jgi:transcriptional regulator with XRE-family HTH domain